jgi:hypothetical protein
MTRVSDGCLVAMLRCSTCGWWLPDGSKEYGVCMSAPEVDPDKGPKVDTYNDAVWDIITPAKFGCVLWDRKD